MLKAKRAAVTVGIILLSIAGLSGCGRNRKLVDMASAADNTGRELVDISTSDTEYFGAVDEIVADGELEETKQLTALVDDLEVAEEIANLYGIRLDSFSYGVATYSTDKDIQEIINLGEKNDYPTLTPNHHNKLHAE